MWAAAGANGSRAKALIDAQRVRTYRPGRRAGAFTAFLLPFAADTSARQVCCSRRRRRRQPADWRMEPARCCWPSSTRTSNWPASCWIEAPYDQTCLTARAGHAGTCIRLPGAEGGAPDSTFPDPRRPGISDRPRSRQKTREARRQRQRPPAEGTKGRLPEPAQSNRGDAVSARGEVRSITSPWCASCSKAARTHRNATRPDEGTTGADGGSGRRRDHGRRARILEPTKKALAALELAFEVRRDWQGGATSATNSGRPPLHGAASIARRFDRSHGRGFLLERARSSAIRNKKGWSATG